MSTIEAKEKFINACPLVVYRKVSYETCVKCCFGSEPKYVDLIEKKETCSRGCCYKEIYRMAVIDCGFREI